MKDELNRIEKFFAKLTKDKLPPLSKQKKDWTEKRLAGLSLLATALAALGAWNVWEWGNRSIYSIYPSTDLIGGYYLNSTSYSPGMDWKAWIGLGLMLAATFFFFKAWRSYKQSQFGGWHSAFHGLLLTLGYSVFAALTDSYLSYTHITLVLLLTLLGLYGLFQVRTQASRK